MPRQLDPSRPNKRADDSSCCDSSRATAVERVPLGNRHVLHSPLSGAILTTDDLGLAILSDPVAPVANASAVPPAVVEDILGAWKSAGLFDQARLPFPDAVADDGHPARHRRAYSSEWGRLSVETDDAVLARQVDEILWTFLSKDALPLPGSATLRCVACAGGDLGVFRDGRALWGRASRDVARYLIVREAAEALCGVDRVGAVLHGAAVVSGERGLLILGDSGRGKSTLAQGLVDAGCGFLADDHLPLHVDGRRLLAFPTGSAVKHGARDLGEVRRLLALHGDRGNSRDGVSYLPLEPAAGPGTAVPLVAVVFPECVARAEAEMTRMDCEAAFIAAIASGSRPSRRQARIAPLAELFNHTPAYALRYGSSAQSVPACLDLLAA